MVEVILSRNVSEPVENNQCFNQIPSARIKDEREKEETARKDTESRKTLTGSMTAEQSPCAGERSKMRWRWSKKQRRQIFKLNFVLPPLNTTEPFFSVKIKYLIQNCFSFLQTIVHTVFAERMLGRVLTLPPLDNAVVL